MNGVIFLDDLDQRKPGKCIQVLMAVHLPGMAGARSVMVPEIISNFPRCAWMSLLQWEWRGEYPRRRTLRHWPRPTDQAVRQCHFLNDTAGRAIIFFPSPLWEVEVSTATLI